MLSSLLLFSEVETVPFNAGDVAQHIVHAVYLKNKQHTVDLVTSLSEDEAKEVMSLLDNAVKSVAALKLVEILFAISELEDE